MDAHQIALVQDSFAYVVPISEETAADFYARLFEITPHVRPLFASDMAEQGRKLVMTIATVVASLDKLDTVLPTARELAIRHVRYGAIEAHYDAVGMALLDTLRIKLGTRFDAAVEAAWAEAYQTLAGAMIDAARAAA